jgi:predicted small integral membrane protein
MTDQDPGNPHTQNQTKPRPARKVSLGANTRPRPDERRGFLPFTNNAFDRVFISILLFIAIHLLWMRFVEAAVPLTVATLIALALGFVIIWKG